MKFLKSIDIFAGMVYNNIKERKRSKSGVPYHKVGAKKAVCPTIKWKLKSGVPYHKWELKK